MKGFFIKFFILFFVSCWMSWKRGFGAGLIFIGIFIIAAARVLTGAVVGARPNNFLGLLGIFVLVFGIVLVLATETLERKVGEKEEEGEEDLKTIHKRRPGDTYASYFSKPKHKMVSAEKYFHERVVELSSTSKDEWISQWELKGLKREFEKAGFKVRGPEKDVGGLRGPDVKHLKVEGYGDADKYIRKHLFITSDYEDERLTKRSAVYRSYHPRDYEA